MPSITITAVQACQLANGEDITIKSDPPQVKRRFIVVLTKTGNVYDVLAPSPPVLTRTGVLDETVSVTGECRLIARGQHRRLLGHTQEGWLSGRGTFTEIPLAGRDA
jgi:hypothetical protein